MIDFYNDIQNILKKNAEILFGISSTDFSEYKTDYKCALVLAVPYKELLGINNYTEVRFESLVCEARVRSNKLLKEITTVLSYYKVHYYIPPTAQSSEDTLIAPFSYKFACINAGLGWIGKNDVLVTEKYGPRVRLSAILINYELPAGIPVTESKCPPGCNLCVESCPYNALTGRTWNINTKRDDIIDYKLCNQKRSLYLEKHNRKNSCGLCMVSCPIGLDEFKNVNLIL